MRNPNPNHQGDLPESPRVRPQDVANALQGADFPTDRDGLLEHARRKGAPDSLVRALGMLPEERYSNARQVSDAFHELAQRE